MTVTVEVKHKAGHYKDILVEQYHPLTGKPSFLTRRLTEGESMEVTVHDGNAFRVVELAKVVNAEVKPVQSEQTR